MIDIPHNGMPSTLAPSASAQETAPHAAIPRELVADLRRLATMALAARVSADEIELIRRNIEILELLLGGQAFGQQP